MERIVLLEKIEAVAPALAQSDSIPIMKNFWFTGTRVMADNDTIAISLPLKTDFKGAVDPALLSLLRNSRAREANFDDREESTLKLKLASSKVSLARLPTDDFTSIFEMPKLSEKPTFQGKDAKALVKAISACLRSVGHDISVPEQLGVTLVPQKDGTIRLYATNDRTLSFATLQSKARLEDRTILSVEFCKQMSKLAKDADPAIDLADDYALMVSGGIYLHGRLLRSDNPVQFDEQIAHHLPKGAEKKLIEIPTKMKLIIERAVIMTASKSEPPITKVSIRDGRATFTSASDRGTITDEVQLEGHPDVALKLDPCLLKLGHEGAEKVLFTERAVVLTNEAATFMIAASQG